MILQTTRAPAVTDPLTTTVRLVLASASPRRRDLLDGLDLDFEVRPVEVDETPRPGERPAAMVERLAREKAAARSAPGEIVLAADTVVVLDGEILGKPADRDEAVRMLTRLAGREHEVLTGIALLEGASGRTATAVDRTLVSMTPLADRRIGWYVDTGEPMDKAGAYAIQGLGAAFVDSIRGSYTNVVGLPLPRLRSLMAELGCELFGFRQSST